MKAKTILALTLGALAGAGAVIFLRRQAQSPAGRLPNQSIYRLYAPVYDALFGPLYAAARRRSVALLELQPGESLLISGVGTGLDLPLLPAGVSALGVDVSAEMLEQARAKECSAQVELRRMDAQRLELPEAAFDAVLLNLIVSVAPDGAAVFREAWRVLKPGGRLVLFDKFAPEGASLSPLRRLAGWALRWIGTDVNRRLSEIRCEAPDLQEEVNRPDVFFGQYRLLRYRKAQGAPRE